MNLSSVVISPVETRHEDAAQFKVDVEDEDRIAVIGLACRFPGADTPQALWQLLSQGGSGLGELPADRWERPSFARYKNALAEKLTLRGGFLRGDVHAFDALTFRISPAEARIIDPQQRLFLEVAWEALEDAAHSGDAPESVTTGVFVGASTNHYREVLAEVQDGALTLDPLLGLGNALGVIANRTSYALNLRGPSYAVDTLCSSSLVALHLATQSIKRGECDVALAGGVHLHLSPSSIAIEARLSALSPSAASRPFDQLADGFAAGEGAACVVLKSLRRAIADGDHIYAVVRGSSTVHGGRSNGLAAPSSQGQEQMVLSALRDGGVDPDSICLLEAHGAGTRLGDPVEVGALSRAYRQYTQRSGYCAIGSVKANFGHLEAAAGVAGFMKVVLALNHRAIPPSANFAVPNPLVEFERSPFFVPDRRMPWTPDPRRPRRAAVSSFGLGGANAHVVLEEWTDDRQSAAQAADTAHALLLSARTATALAALRSRLGAWLDGPDGQTARLQDLCFSLNAGRFKLPHRAAFVAKDRDELRQLFAAASATCTGSVLGGARESVALWLPGDGAISSSQLAEASARHPAMRQAVAECQRAGADPGRQELASFCAEYALGRFWLGLGITPSAFVGRGRGALCADVLSGRKSLRDAIDHLLAGRVPNTAMAATEPTSPSLRLCIGAPAEPRLDQISTLRHGLSLDRSLALSAAELFVRGVEIDWNAFYRDSGARRISLPTYPFERERIEPPAATWPGSTGWRCRSRSRCTTCSTSGGRCWRRCGSC